MERKFLPCFTCAKEFKSIRALKQHKQDQVHLKGPNKGEEWTKLQALESYFEAYYEEQVMVTRTDRRKSRKLVMNVIDEIRNDFKNEEDEEDEEDEKEGHFDDEESDEFVNKEDNDLYRKTVEYAGSTATQTKVHLADEFDFNFKIEIHEDDLEVLTQGKFAWYEVEKGNDKQLNHLSESWKIENRKRPLRIPPGYATVRITDPNHYKNNSWWSQVTHNDFLIPRFVQEDLYEKASGSITDDDSTTVRDRPNGPAITVNIKPNETVSHHISVDLVAALTIEKTANDYGWPRVDTWRTVPEETVHDVSEQNLFLVPKSNNFWYISFDNAGKHLMRSIDEFDECRLRVHRILKQDFLKWKSEQAYPGVSTFMFKNHLFWYNEQLPRNVDAKQYWRRANIGQCYMDFLLDFAERLEDQELLNYFNPQDNILDGKNPRVLNRLANMLRERRNQIDNIVPI